MASEVENFHKSLKIHLINPRDEKKAVHIIWTRIFLKTVMNIVMERILDIPIMSMSLVIGVLGFFQHYSLLQGVVLFLTVPCMIYLLVRTVQLPRAFYKSNGFSEGIYNYWSQNDIGRHLWVAESNGNVIGTAAVDLLSATTAQVFRVAVEDNFTGKGVGRLLMDTILEHCKERRFEHVVLFTSHIQVAAMKLYEKMGFKRLHVTWAGPSLLKYKKNVYHFSPMEQNPGLWSNPDSVDLMF